MRWSDGIKSNRQQCHRQFKSTTCTSNPLGMTNRKPISLEQLFKYYKHLPHQAASIPMLEEDLVSMGYDLAMRRDRPWFATWSQSGKQFEHKAALELIKLYEGFHHDAYLCPARVWSIAWGSTVYSDGSSVMPGDRIDQAEGDRLLESTVDQVKEVLEKSIPYYEKLKENQQSALISFAYNLGAYFYGQEGFETISRCLREQDYAGVPGAMLLYINKGSSFEIGLRRRRKAEGLLWKGGDQSPKIETAKLRPSSPFSSRLTPHITLGEFALGREERRFQAQFQLDTAALLAAFLERARTRFGNKPVVITSGYRPPGINRSVGGASQSEHLYPVPNEGAVDFFIQGVNAYDLQEYCDQNWPHSLGYGASRGFCHLGIRDGGQHIRWDY